jgi:hypothetical protein
MQEVRDSHGLDVRDLLQLYGVDGPEKIKTAIINAISPEQLREQYKTVLEKKAGEGPDAISKPIEYDLVTCAELMVKTIIIRYLIKRVLVELQPMIVSGPKKVLKTSLLLCVAIALAAGLPLLGQFEVDGPATVCVMTGESGLATIKETIRRIAKTMDVDPTALTNLLITEQLPQFGSPAHLEALRKLIIDKGVKVLIIDPAYLCLDGDDAGNLFKVGSQLRGMTEICRATGCTMILCHHARKNLTQPFAMPELEDIAWAGFQEFARQWMLVNRRERYIPGSGVHRLWLVFGGSAGHGSAWGLDVNEGEGPERVWEATLIPYDQLKQTNEETRQKAKDEAKGQQLEQDRKLVCQAMVKYPGGETRTTISDTAGMSRTRFNRALASLLDDKVVVPVEISKGNHKKLIEGYRLKDSEA